MRLTILFGGNSRERLVSVASAQAVSDALPEAELWFWAAGDSISGDRIFAASREALLAHERPFERAFTADGALIGPLAQALDAAKSEHRVLVLALHGGSPENGEFQILCELRGVPFTGSGSASSHLAFDKIAAKRFAALAGIWSPADVTLDEADEALSHYGKLIAKPAQDGSSFGLMFINSAQDIAAVRQAAATTEYVIEPFIAGSEATCGVLEQADGSLIALPPVEIVTASGTFDYESKYLAKSTQEICPARFAPEMNARLQVLAIAAHRALSCRGYSRSDFIIGKDGPVYLETNTLPGLTKASLYPKSLAAQGIGFVDFLQGQVDIAVRAGGGMTDHYILLLTLFFTVIYTSAALLAIILAYRQVRSSFDISTREKSLDAYLTFSGKYAELTRLGHDIDLRFHNRDLTLCEHDIKFFFNEFWVLQLQEWEFLQAGILPVRIFTQWMMHSHEYLLSGNTKHFFDANGQPAQITTREGFEKYGVRVLRFHPGFVAFLRELKTIPYDAAEATATYAPIESLTRKYLRGNSYWR